MISEFSNKLCLVIKCTNRESTTPCLHFSAKKREGKAACQFINDITFQMAILEGLKKDLGVDKPSDFADCVRWARFIFEENFHNTIAQLLYNFPPDQKTTSGAAFWSGPKRCPTAIIFDSDNVRMRYFY